MWKLFVLSCWLLIALSSLSLADNRLEQARALYAAGRYYQAAALLEELRSSDPDDFEIGLLLARVLASTEQFEEALGLAEVFLASQPEEPDLLNIRAVSLFELGKSGEARQAMEQALTLHPDNPKLLYNSAFYRTGLTEGASDDQVMLAIGEIDRLLTLAPSAAAYELRGRLKNKYLHDPQAALNDLDQAVALEPENGARYFSRGLILQEMDRLAEAIEDLEKAVRVGTLAEESWAYHAKEALVRLKYPPGSPQATLRSETYLAGSLATALPTPSLKELEKWQEPGILVTPKGLLASQETGFGFTPWELISAVRVDGNGVILLVGDLTHEKMLVFQTGPTYTRTSYQDGEPRSNEVTHDRPYLLDAAAFEQLVVRSAGLSLHQDEGDHRLYGKSSQPGLAPDEESFIPMGDPLKEKALGWPPERLAALPDQPGLTINDTGVAFVTSHQIQSVRWEEIKSVESDGAELIIYGDQRRNTIGIFPGSYCLQAQDRLEAARLLREGREPLEAETFFPLLVLDPQYADALGLTLWQPEVAAERGGFELWPFNLQAEGLYLTPQGISEVDLYTIHLAPWESITELIEGSRGWITYKETTLTPRNEQELPAFVAFRRKIVEGAGLQSTGLSSTPYERGASPAPVGTQSWRFPLSQESAWKGLPLATLAERAGKTGLHLLPEGLLSVTESRLDLVPWAELSTLDVNPAYESPASSRMIVRAPNYEGNFPPDRGDLKLPAEEVLKALARYVELDSEGQVLRVLSASGAILIPYEKKP